MGEKERGRCVCVFFSPHLAPSAKRKKVGEGSFLWERFSGGARTSSL